MCFIGLVISFLECVSMLESNLMSESYEWFQLPLKVQVMTLQAHN